MSDTRLGHALLSDSEVAQGSTYQQASAMQQDDSVREGSTAYDPYNAFATSTCIETGPDTQQEPEVNTEAAGITTVMVYNIPFHLPAQAVTDMFDHHGFVDTYDWFHMPLSSGRLTSAQGLGFAFINFKAVQFATEVLALFEKFHFNHSDQTKMSGTKVAKHQGRERNIQVLQNAGQNKKTVKERHANRCLANVAKA